MYHFFTTLLGIRPGAMGFASVHIKPQLGPLRHAHGTLVHPQGTITVDLTARAGKATGFVELPAGLTGEFVAGGELQQLRPGRQSID